jgi:hypothetical protein
MLRLLASTRIARQSLGMRLMSSTQEPLGLHSLGSLFVRQAAGSRQAVRLEFLPGWIDDTTLIGMDNYPGARVEVDWDAQKATLHLEDDPTTSTGPSAEVLQILMPEKLDVDVNISRGDLLVAGTKIESPNRLRLATRFVGLLCTRCPR